MLQNYSPTSARCLKTMNMAPIYCARCIKRAGYEVIVSRDGRDALAKLGSIDPV